MSLKRSDLCFLQVLPDWKLAATWDGVREMLSKTHEAQAHPKVRQLAG